MDLGCRLHIINSVAGVKSNFVKDFFEQVLFYLSFIFGAVFLMAVVAMFNVGVQNKIQIGLFLVVCVGNFVLGTINRRTVYKNRKKKIHYGRVDVMYFFYSVSFVYLLLSVFVKFLGWDTRSMEYGLITQMFDRMYIYAFVLGVILYLLYLVESYLMGKIKNRIWQMVFSVVFVEIIFLICALNGKYIGMGLLKLWFTPIYQSVFVLISTSPLFYYLKSLYVGSDLVDRESRPKSID